MATILSAILGGVGVLLTGNLPWIALLAPLNLRIWPALPWAVVPMALYLWAYWRCIGGRWGSPGSAADRRVRLRANPLAAGSWPLAIITGLVGFGALFALLAVMPRLVTLPSTGAPQTPPGMPAATAFILLTMASMVAGVTEEAGFRGYMQGPIERRYGLAAGILINGTMFGLLHFQNHPDAVLTMLPYYVAVAAVYGGLTWAADSILPALALHAGGDVWSLTRLWSTGRPEWQLSEGAPPLVWTTGLDLPFVSASIALLLLAAVMVLLCRILRRLTTSSTAPTAAAV